MIVHLLTAVTRPENLPAIAASIATAQLTAPPIEVVWHMRYDQLGEHPGGQLLKNQMIDGISDGWVWILDDDNVMQGEFLEALFVHAAEHPEAQLIVCAQRHNNGWVRKVNRSMLRETHVDAAQVVARRDAIGDLRIPEHYCGDGAFIEALANQLDPDRITYIHRPVVSYNALRSSP